MRPFPLFFDIVVVIRIAIKLWPWYLLIGGSDRSIFSEIGIFFRFFYIPLVGFSVFSSIKQMILLIPFFTNVLIAFDWIAAVVSRRAV